MVVALLGLALAAAGEAVDSELPAGRCHGQIRLSSFEVPVLNTVGGVTYTTQATNWTVTDEQGQAVGTLDLARRLGDSWVPPELDRRVKKARRIGWSITGASVVATLVGAGAFNAYTNGEGSDGALVLGGTLLGLGGSGLIIGPIWGGVRPIALKTNPAVFYSPDVLRPRIDTYNDACGY